MTDAAVLMFPFRPWVRRAGWSIVAVAAFATAAMIVAAHYRWNGDRIVWVYVGTLWLGGLKIVLDTRRPVAEIDDDRLMIRPLHQFVTRRIAWPAIRGTEQSGDRLIVYFDTGRGMRFVALNLNLVKGRRDFLQLLDQRFAAMRFAERLAGGSRCLSRPTHGAPPPSAANSS